MCSSIGTKIRARRAEKRLKQSELASAAGIHVNTVSRAERGDDIRVSVLRRLAEALGLTPAELFDA